MKGKKLEFLKFLIAFLLFITYIYSKWNGKRVAINPNGFANTKGTSHNRMDSGGQALTGKQQQY